MDPERLIASPACQLPPKAMTALEQAPIDDVIAAGAFAEMGHLPLAAVLGDALQYANQMLDGLRAGASKALMPGRTETSLLALPLLPEDQAFVSQVMALQDLAIANAILPDTEAESGPTLAQMYDAARGHLLDLYRHWADEPGRRSERFRVQKGQLGYLYPSAVVVGTSSRLTPGNQPDTFALFVALPLMAPYLAHEEDCFVAPRLE